MTSIPHILSLYSVAWVPWMLLVALVLFVVCISLYPQLIKECFYSYVSHQHRAFSQYTNKWQYALPTFVYKMLILSLLLYVWVIDKHEASFQTFGWICLIVVAFMTIRRICFTIASFVFDLQQTQLPPLASFNQLELALCLSLFPITLIAIHTGFTMCILIITLVLIGIYIVLFCLKAISALSDDAPAWILFVLYLITVIILPAGGAVRLAQYLG